MLRKGREGEKYYEAEVSHRGEKGREASLMGCMYACTYIYYEYKEKMEEGWEGWWGSREVYKEAVRERVHEELLVKVNLLTSWQ